MIYQGDSLEVLKTLDAASVHCCITSPPYYGLRDYGVPGQIGLEPTPEEYVSRMVDVFREVRRVLRDDGTCWLNLGDSYAGSANSVAVGKQDSQYRGVGLPTKSGEGLKPKDLIGIPWRVAFALQADGWYLRQDVIWHKPNPMPESVRDRCTKAHEYLFLLSKSARYYFDAEAIKEPSVPGTKPPGNKKGMNRGRVGGGSRWDESPNPERATPPFRNKRSVWTVSTRPYKGAHFATFPPKLIEPCVLASTSQHGCCSACGSPWERVVERDRKATRPGRDTKATGNRMTDGSRDPERHVTETKTVGWRPTCDCNADVVPCVVLDPFFGAGTTGVVARQHGRRYVGVELNPEYIELARQRLQT